MKSITETLFKNDLEILTNYKLIAGMDEVGRGPLAGPVVVCCVIMPYDEMIDGVNDSKKVGENKRQKLAQIIKEKAIACEVAVIDEKIIDEINILEATKLAMKNAYENLKIKPDLLLIDAIDKLDIDAQIKGVIKGDATHYSIACASIVAKVERDEMMKEYDKMYSQYNFATNKGYGTKQHIEAIKTFGPCEIHRKSFIKHFV